MVPLLLSTSCEKSTYLRFPVLSKKDLLSYAPHLTPAWVRVAPETSTTAEPPSIRRTEPVMKDESSLAR
jgi:hypothetical protein